MGQSFTIRIWPSRSMICALISPTFFVQEDFVGQLAVDDLLADGGPQHLGTGIGGAGQPLSEELLQKRAWPRTTDSLCPSACPPSASRSSTASCPTKSSVNEKVGEIKAQDHRARRPDR